jgi:hypothetical protein
MRKFLTYWLAPLSVIGLAAATLAGPCYKNTFTGNTPPPACVWNGVPVTATSCNWELFSGPFPNCDGIIESIATPTGTSGNEPNGLMNQGVGPFTCRVFKSCTTTTIFKLPYGWRTICKPNAVAVHSTAMVFGAIGAVCPTPPPPPPATGGTTTPVVSALK